MKGLDKQRFEVTVCAFYDGGELQEEVEALPGVRFVSLSKRGRWDVVGFLARLRAAIRVARPHIVHGYMPIANEFALLMARWSGAKCVWGMRASNVDFGATNTVAQGAFLGPARCCHGMSTQSFSIRKLAALNYSKHGYAPERNDRHSNGIDCVRFRPCAEEGWSIREEWGPSSRGTLSRFGRAFRSTERSSDFHPRGGFGYEGLSHRSVRVRRKWRFRIFRAARVGGA